MFSSLCVLASNAAHGCYLNRKKKTWNENALKIYNTNASHRQDFTWTQIKNALKHFCFVFRLPVIVSHFTTSLFCHILWGVTLGVIMSRLYSSAQKKRHNVLKRLKKCEAFCTFPLPQLALWGVILSRLHWPIQLGCEIFLRNVFVKLLRWGRSWLYSEKRHNVLKRLKREAFIVISELEETWRQELILQLLLWTTALVSEQLPAYKTHTNQCSA